MSKPSYIGWKSGFPGKVKPEVAYEELEKIRKQNDGDLTPKAVVAAARPKEHPLHPQIFSLGQKAAAEQWYQEQARRTINSIVVTYEESKKTPPTRCYSVVREERPEKKGARNVKIFGSTSEALADPEQREYVLSQAIRELAALRQRYAALSELAHVFQAIDRAAGDHL